jgi:hypothetical protein
MYSTYGGIRKLYNSLVRKPEENSRFGGPRCTSEDKTREDTK